MKSSAHPSRPESDRVVRILLLQTSDLIKIFKKAYFLSVSSSSSRTETSTSANNSTEPVRSSFSSGRVGLYKKKSYRNLPCGVNSAAYIGGVETEGMFGVGTVELFSPNLRTSLVNSPWRNFIVSGPLNRTTERDLSLDAIGPASSRPLCIFRR